ncbi:hypothetical protein BE17_53485 [Sorangium cellulosum]|uniref:Uncharacterized protein n=1 Tax=Sorangium cellulosum TaxID=56 RepID=A0A150SPC5_SORCE|nr:hypothetical protein BE17_53485 [Sorangium cellulosum]
MKRWSTARVAALGYLAASGCDAEITSVGAWAPVVPGSSYVEAELGELTDGFTVGEDGRASAGRFIVPPGGMSSDEAPGPARARYSFEAPSRGEYVIWGRIHAPSAINNRFWFQVDGGEWYLWRISVGEIWFWDDLHDDVRYGEPLRFSLAAGTHELVIANAVDGVWLDRLYFTPDGDEPPGNDTPCDPPHSIEVGGECLPSCGALKGTECGAVACAGREPLEAYDCSVCCRVEEP